MTWITSLKRSEVIDTSDQIDQVFHTSHQIQIIGIKMCSHVKS